MRKIVGLQIVMTVVLALISGLWAGLDAALSAMWGGVVCFVPNALLALRLYVLQVRGKSGLGVHTFFLGEAVKLVLTLALLGLVVRHYDALVWPALIVSIVASLKSYLLVFLFDRNRFSSSWPPLQN